MSDINITSIILSYLIPATLGAGIGFLSSKLKKDKAKDKAIEEGVQALLRNELVREYREYKAKGELTELLLPIVALDDAMGLVVFAISFGIAKAFNSGTVDLFSVVVDNYNIFACLFNDTKFSE